MPSIDEILNAAKTGAPIETPYFRYAPDNTWETLWIVCSHIGFPAGKFAQSHVFRHLEGGKLFFNCPGNHWYLKGVPGIADDLDGVVRFTRRFVEAANMGRTCVAGHSMGAFLALTLGLSIPGVRFLSSSPEIILGFEGSRSQAHGVLDRDVFFRQLALRPREASDQAGNGLILFGAFDPIDAFALHQPAFLSGELGGVREVFHHHGVTEYLNASGHVYLEVLKQCATLDDAGAATPDILKPAGTFGKPAEFEAFYRSEIALRRGKLDDALAAADHFADWANPGWQHQRSKIYSKAGRRHEAQSAASRAFSDAPHVYEHAIQLGCSALALGDTGVLRSLVEPPGGVRYNHRNYDKFLSEIEAYLATGEVKPGGFLRIPGA